MTRGHCLNECILNHHDDVCGNSTVPILFSPFSEDDIRRHQDKRSIICTNFTMIKQAVEHKCSDKCKCDLSYNYYQVYIQPMTRNEDNTTSIWFEHNEMPDITVKYVPEISFIMMVCNWGGLIGMWLGLSFLTMIKDTITYMAKVFMLKHMISYIYQNLTLKVYPRICCLKHSHHANIVRTSSTMASKIDTRLRVLT